MTRLTNEKAGANEQPPSGAGRVASVNLSAGGVPKTAVGEAEVAVDGMVGDRQRDRRHHGGPDRALCLYGAERIAGLRAEGHAVEPGSLGENLTVGGLDWSTVAPGKRYLVGEVQIEITSFAAPCKTIRRWFSDGYFNRVAEHRYPGWSRVYARVLVPGQVRVGDEVRAC